MMRMFELISVSLTVSLHFPCREHGPWSTDVTISFEASSNVSTLHVYDNSPLGCMSVILVILSDVASVNTHMSTAASARSINGSSGTNPTPHQPRHPSDLANRIMP
jgi:hypothetical protein